ncbi:MAG: hypothetical protein AAF202_07475 [Pseudomonadota bacterium]
MKLRFTVLAVLSVLISGQSALACTWAPPEESKMVEELKTIGLTAVSSDPSKINVIIEPVDQSYSVEETNSTGMCPDEVHFSGQYAVRYDVDNGLATTCNVIITVTKNVPWTQNPKVSYEIEDLTHARCTR